MVEVNGSIGSSGVGKVAVEGSCGSRGGWGKGGNGLMEFVKGCGSSEVLTRLEVVELVRVVEVAESVEIAKVVKVMEAMDVLNVMKVMKVVDAVDVAVVSEMHFVYAFGVDCFWNFNCRCRAVFWNL